jgi:hypothetical protein
LPANANALLPLSVTKPAPPITEGGEVLSRVLREKMYPTIGTIPVPKAGLEIGKGATTNSPRCARFFSDGDS